MNIRLLYKPTKQLCSSPIIRTMSTFIEAPESRKIELAENYQTIIKKVNQLNPKVNLIAVSKIKPSSDIKALYDIGVRHFGENYVQELIGKSQELPKDIKWHFIGGLQSGKAKDLAKHVDSLYAVETIDSLKKCKQLDSTRERVSGNIINVFLQINTSAEEQKSGYNSEVLDDVEETVKFLLSEECKKLKLIGLMTIGSFSESTSEAGENQDFKKLVEVKQILDKKYNLDLELSMGMSHDFEQAIKQGSTNVRVGSSIFGARPPKNST